MKRFSKRTAIILTITAIIVGVVIYLAFFNHGKPIVTLNDNTGRVNPQPLFIDPAEVSVMSYGFEPRTIKIKQGQAVVWTNKDAKLHQIASDPYPGEDGLAGFVSQGASLRTEIFLFTFFTKGTYPYHDHLNPGTYKGIVIVE
jgi:plastocyanin